MFDPDMLWADLCCALISPFLTTGFGLTERPSLPRPSVWGKHSKGRESPNLCWRAASWLPAPSLCRPLAHSCPSLRSLHEWPEQPGLELHQLCGPAHPHLSPGEQWRICSHLPKCDFLKNKQKPEWGKRHSTRRGQLQAGIYHSLSARSGSAAGPKLHMYHFTEETRLTTGLTVPQKLNLQSPPRITAFNSRFIGRGRDESRSLRHNCSVSQAENSDHRNLNNFSLLLISLTLCPKQSLK